MLTVIVQKLFAVTVPPDRLMLVPAGFAVTEPPQLLVVPGGVVITRPEGNESLKATPVIGRLFVLVILKETVVVPPTGMAIGLKVFRMLGGATTVIFALDELPVPPSVDVTGPAVFV